MSVNHYAIKQFRFEEYSDEVCRYVLEGALPTSQKVIEVVDHFERIAALSPLDT